MSDTISLTPLRDYLDSGRDPFAIAGPQSMAEWLQEWECYPEQRANQVTNCRRTIGELRDGTYSGLASIEKNWASVQRFAQYLAWEIEVYEDADLRERVLAILPAETHASMADFFDTMNRPIGYTTDTGAYWCGTCGGRGDGPYLRFVDRADVLREWPERYVFCPSCVDAWSDALTGALRAS